MDSYQYLQKIPIAINNYYGDPVLQWENTLEKVCTLAQDKHLGPVGIITKGEITPSMAQELKDSAQDLKLVVLVSISELPKEVEPVGQAHRYRTLKNLVSVGIPAIGYVRPMVPPFNTDMKTIDNMFHKIKDAGCDHIIVSGFRGDDHIIDQMQPDRKQEWVLRVKLMSPEIGKICRETAEHYGLYMFTRTSCGVASVLKLKRSFNPYYISPRGAGCDTCSLNSTCGHVEPDPSALNFLESLGYDLEYTTNSGQKCQVDPANRLSCLSCCTSCFVINNTPRITIKNPNIRLGDVAFVRFITGGVLTSKENVVDGGDPNVGHVNFPSIKMPSSEVHCINTWYVWAHQQTTCYQCHYCITTVYKLEEREYGSSPKELSNYLDNYVH